MTKRDKLTMSHSKGDMEFEILESQGSKRFLARVLKDGSEVTHRFYSYMYMDRARAFEMAQTWVQGAFDMLDGLESRG